MKAAAARLKDDLPALFIAMKRRETPAAAKALALLAVAYALSPIDLIPDFIPVLGYLDDLLLLPAMTALAIMLIPDTLMEDCRREAKDLWQNGKPKKWYYALPVLLPWLLIAAIVIKLLFFRG